MQANRKDAESAKHAKDTNGSSDAGRWCENPVSQTLVRESCLAPDSVVILREQGDRRISLRTWATPGLRGQILRSAQDDHE